MIDWEETQKLLGTISKIPKKTKVCVRCDDCGVLSYHTKHYHYRRVRDVGGYYCRQCSALRSHANRSAGSKKAWSRIEYKEKQKSRTHSEQLKTIARDKSKALWQQQEYIDKQKANFNYEKSIENLKKGKSKAAKVNKERMRSLWQENTYRTKMSQQSVVLWQDKDYREKATKALEDYYNNPTLRLEMSQKARERFKDDTFRDRWLKSLMESFTQGRKSRISVTSLANWAKKEYRTKIETAWDYNKRKEMSDICQGWWSDEKRAEVSELMLSKWSDQQYRENMCRAFKSAWTEERKKIVRDGWTEDRRQAMSIKTRKWWENPEYVQKIISIANKPSSLEITFASVLDDCGVKYESQKHIGPYLFDFLVGNTLVEIQGDYWHSLPATVTKDKAKATYISDHYKYKIVYIWEHEFYQVDKIYTLVKNLFCGNIVVNDVDFNKLIFRQIQSVEAKLLFEKYHYKGSLGRSGYAYGIFYGETLIGACVFASPTRNVAGGELTRFVIHPQYQVKNLASWFLSRAVKAALKNYKHVFTFADPNFNNIGTIYKASNWECLGEVPSDYWYVGEGGWIMHKKTLFNRAKNMGIKEFDYAAAYKYTKVWGLPKIKFVYKR